MDSLKPCASTPTGSTGGSSIRATRGKRASSKTWSRPSRFSSRALSAVGRGFRCLMVEGTAQRGRVLPEPGADEAARVTPPVLHETRLLGRAREPFAKRARHLPDPETGLRRRHGDLAGVKLVLPELEHLQGIGGEGSEPARRVGDRASCQAGCEPGEYLDALRAAEQWALIRPQGPRSVSHISLAVEDRANELG